MSRCFPFPPPGYEARPRREEQHKDLPRKEKHKEKKHRKAKDRRKGETKEKDRDHRKDKHNRKHKRGKCGESKKNKDIYKDTNQTLRHRKPEENGQHESVKDIIPADELVTQIFAQGDHTDHKGNNTELFSWITDSISCARSKEKECNSLGRIVKKSAQATEDYYEMVQKSDRIAHANKKGMGRGIDSKIEIKDGKSLQDRSAEMHSRRRRCCNGVDVCHDNSDTQRSSEGVHTANSVVSGSEREANARVTPNPKTLQRAEETGQDPDISVHSANVKNYKISTKGMMREENQCANNSCGKMDWQFARNNNEAVERKEKCNYHKGLEGKDRDRDSVVKKRKTEYKNKEKEVEKNGTVNEQKYEDLGASKGKVDNAMHLGCLNEQKFTSDIKIMKDSDPNSHPHGRHERQESYNNGIIGSRYSEEHMPSVSSSGYESNKGYLKLPHADNKYLSQVHCIPSQQDLSEYIDQDWLFSEDHVKRTTETFEAAESRQVWSDALLIDSADVIAMPYVISL